MNYIMTPEETEIWQMLHDYCQQAQVTNKTIIALPDRIWYRAKELIESINCTQINMSFMFNSYLFVNK